MEGRYENKSYETPRKYSKSFNLLTGDFHENNRFKSGPGQVFSLYHSYIFL